MQPPFTPFPSRPLDRATIEQLYLAFLSPYLPDITDVAARARLPVGDVIDWLALPETIDKLEKLLTGYRLRAKILVTQTLPAVINSLSDTAQSMHPPASDAPLSIRARYQDTSRRASSRLIDLYQFEIRSSEGPAPSPKPRARREHPAPPAPAPDLTASTENLAPQKNEPPSPGPDASPEAAPSSTPSPLAPTAIPPPPNPSSPPESRAPP